MTAFSKPGSRPGRVVGALIAAAAMTLVAGCQSSSTPSAPTAQVAAKAVEKKVPQAEIAVDPAPNSRKVHPDAVVTVHAADGKLTDVSVTDRMDREVKGALSSDGLTWTASGRLRVGTDYWVHASAVDSAGLTTRSVSYFATVKPKAKLTTSISPVSGATVGVGMPIVVRLSAPVKNRAAVERALTVHSSKRAPGAWSWISDEELHYRPRNFWPAYNDVSVKVRLRGVDAGRGVWGAEDRTIRFEVGASMITVVRVKKHHATIYRNGKVARRVPVSTGKAGFLTRGGTKVVLEKHRLKVMDASTIGIGRNDPEYYRLDVPYALRVTWSGEFVHAAPWSVASQGRDNVSHGCVGMSISNGIWLYNRTNIGDVVRVKGSPRALEPGNGWTDWNVPWSQWLKGSAL